MPIFISPALVIPSAQTILASSRRERKVKVVCAEGITRDRLYPEEDEELVFGDKLTILPFLFSAECLYAQVLATSIQTRKKMVWKDARAAVTRQWPFDWKPSHSYCTTYSPFFLFGLGIIHRRMILTAA